MSLQSIGLMIVSWTVGAYLLFETIDFIGSRCCYSPPSAARGPQHRLSIWGDDLSAVAANPKTLGRAALIRLARIVQGVTGIELITRGELVKSLTLIERATLLMRLMRRCGPVKGFKAYAVLMEGLSHYPDTMDEAIYFCEHVLKEAEVMANACR